MGGIAGNYGYATYLWYTWSDFQAFTTALIEFQVYQGPDMDCDTHTFVVSAG